MTKAGNTSSALDRAVWAGSHPANSRVATSRVITLRAKPHEFPRINPAGYPPLADDPVFNSESRLALDPPERVRSVEDFDYSVDVMARTPSAAAFIGPFRLPTHEGAKVLTQVVRGLKRGAKN